MATFVLLACASIAFMSYAALAATQAIFKAPPAGGSASTSAAALAGSADADDASPGTKLPSKTASSPQKGAVRSNLSTTPRGGGAKPTAEDDD